MSDKVTLLMSSLNEFYKDGTYINQIKPILEQKGKVSLRILDWFITNYSKKNRTLINDNSFDVYQNYKLMLRSFSKRQFDPFCRKNKIVFYYSDISKNSSSKGVEENFIETSCGQLCFFRWCFQNGIIDYVEKNLDQIEEDMKESLKSSDLTKKEKKRQQLSVSAARSVSKRNVKYTITFD
jgi:hypothetical protein